MQPHWAPHLGSCCGGPLLWRHVLLPPQPGGPLHLRLPPGPWLLQLLTVLPSLPSLPSLPLDRLQQQAEGVSAQLPTAVQSLLQDHIVLCSLLKHCSLAYQHCCGMRLCRLNVHVQTAYSTGASRGDSLTRA